MSVETVTPGEERAQRDSGLSLIEVIVAMTVFSLIAGATSIALLQVYGGVRDNERRVQAANIAQSQIEAARAQSAVDLPEGENRTTRTVGGKTYQVHTKTGYVAAPPSGQSCHDQAGTLAYKAVQVTVTWENMGSVAPVTADTAIALKPGEVTNSLKRGGFVLLVQDTQGQGIPQATVKASAQGTVVRVTLTDSSGCALVTDLPATPTGTEYTVTITKPSHTASAGVQDKVLTVLVKEQRIAAVPAVTLQQVGTAGVQFAYTGGTPTASLTLHYRPASASSWTALADCTAGVSGPCVDAAAGRIQGLPDGQVGLGASLCSDIPPTDSVQVLVDQNAGTTQAAIPLTVVKIQPKDQQGSPLPPGLTVVMDHQQCKAKGSTFRHSLATTGDATLTTLLPSGTYLPNVFPVGGPEPSTGGRSVFVPSSSQTTTVPLTYSP